LDSVLITNSLYVRPMSMSGA